MNKNLVNEFSIDELEARLEMKAWVEIVECTDPSHCHAQQQ
jgi:hypothetical protein